MTTRPRVTVWNEYRHEHANPEVAAIYLLSLVSIPLWWAALRSRPVEFD